tara:strand:+ start:121 stop:870 length:750 start_codon:yes stop_codon:yes gene_type:complete
MLDIAKMKLHYFHVASDVPEEGKPDVAVVIDVLRATTTIAWALSNGAEAVQTFSDVDDLKHEASKWPESKRLLLGERNGRKIEGFDLGNSPVSVSNEVVFNKRLFMSTTNGTKSLDRVRHAKNLVTLALPNRSAVGKMLLNTLQSSVWIVGSGWEGSYSLEDSLGAGALVDFLWKHSSESVHIVNDELMAAWALWTYWHKDPEACLRKASHGQRLQGIGNHDSDFKCCSELDQISIVPTQVEKGVLCAR